MMDVMCAKKCKEGRVCTRQVWVGTFNTLYQKVNNGGCHGDCQVVNKRFQCDGCQDNHVDLSA